MIVETHDLAKRFGRQDAVRDLSLSVPDGAAYALIGANGAGKTTALRMLVNVLAPDGGRARVLGVDSRKLTWRHFERIGCVSENLKLPERLTVAQYFAYLRTLYAQWDRALEQELRLRFDLPPRRRLGQLSHGMRMKTMVAAALAFRPPLLVLDEPLSGLDPLVRDELIEGLLRQADTTTIVISSHEIADIESFVTHVAFMDRGRLVLEEPIESVSARFRDVRVVLAGEAILEALPATWLSPELQHRTLRFVETAFRSDADMAARLGAELDLSSFDVQPMSLRAIAKALMRAAREPQR